MTLGLLIHGRSLATLDLFCRTASSRARVGLLLKLAREGARGPAEEAVQCR